MAISGSERLAKTNYLATSAMRLEVGSQSTQGSPICPGQALFFFFFLPWAKTYYPIDGAFLVWVEICIPCKNPYIFSTFIQSFSQRQKSRMPLCQTIIGEALISVIVRKIMEKPGLDISRFWVSMNIGKSIQNSFFISILGKLRNSVSRRYLCVRNNDLLQKPGLFA